MTAGKKLVMAGAALAVVALTLTGSAAGDPLGNEARSGGEDTGSAGSVTVGSAAFAESEIIAYIYAGALERSGVEVSVTPAIGARDVYIAALEDGSIDLVPEYTGNLLQYFDPKTKATAADDVELALARVLPGDLSILTPSPAEDTDRSVAPDAMKRRANASP